MARNLSSVCSRLKLLSVKKQTGKKKVQRYFHYQMIAQLLESVQSYNKNKRKKSNANIVCDSATKQVVHA